MVADKRGQERTIELSPLRERVSNIIKIVRVKNTYEKKWEICSNTRKIGKSDCTARREKRYIHRHTHFH